MEFCPWAHLSQERLQSFLTDPTNNERAPDRKIAIDYMRENFEKVRLLDVGCGTAHQYLAMKQQLEDFEYLGVDKTQKMVEFARKRFPDAQFVEGDIYDLPFPDCSWPIVFVRHVLTHLPSYKKALPEVARVCSDCLILCLLFPLAGRNRMGIMGKPPERTKPGDFSEHYLNVYAREPFMEMLKGLGFKLDMDCHVEVGGQFKQFELITARRGRDGSL